MPEQPTDPYHVPNAQPFRPAPRSQTPPADENEDSLLHAFFVDTPSQPETPPAELSEQEPQPGMSRRTLIAAGVLVGGFALLYLVVRIRYEYRKYKRNKKRREMAVRGIYPKRKTAAGTNSARSGVKRR